ncbi:MAG: hypothetical protein HND56_07500 [Pseudomonadota bacterium]|nr:hypothetical protein [Pseudomonadota bacterium]QKK05536.1 MAG: hypothetical protein HND56_07500 [Pseudomonadota bacterium]
MKQDYILSIFVSIIALCVMLMPSVVQAQSGEDYYNQRIKIIKECGKDEACLKKAEKAARAKRKETQDFLRGNTDRLQYSEELVVTKDAESAAQSGKTSIADLIKEIEEAKFFRELDQAQNGLKSTSTCGTYRKKAIESRDALDELNSRVQNKTTGNYGRQAQELKDENTNAIKDLETCYARYLPGYPILKAHGILTYDAHTNAYNNLVDFYDSIPSLGVHIAELEAELEKKRQADRDLDNLAIGTERASTDVVAVVSRTHKSVEVLPGGRGNRWKQVKRGYQLRMSDELRTGSEGRARIVFDTAYSEGQAGRAIINIGSDSQVKMTRFIKGMQRPPQSTLDLIRGTVRGFVRNWGYRSSFNVRTGTSLCGIRGTEVAITYNPDTATTDYHLDHGDAFVDAGGQQTTLTPRTSRRFSNGILSAEWPLEKSDWSKILASTGDGLAETLATANASYSELLLPLKASGGVTKAQIVTNDKVKMKAAEAAAEKFIKALQWNDETLLNAAVGGVQKSMLEKNRQNRPLKEWLDGNKQRPTRFDIKCTLCEGNSCEVLAYLETEADLPGAGKDTIFVSTYADEMPDTWRVTATHVEKKRITAFRLKPAFCYQ